MSQIMLEDLLFEAIIITGWIFATVASGSWPILAITTCIIADFWSKVRKVQRLGAAKQPWYRELAA